MVISSTIENNCTTWWITYIRLEITIESVVVCFIVKEYCSTSICKVVPEKASKYIVFSSITVKYRSTTGNFSTIIVKLSWNYIIVWFSLETNCSTNPFSNIAFKISVYCITISFTVKEYCSTLSCTIINEFRIDFTIRDWIINIYSTTYIGSVIVNKTTIVNHSQRREPCCRPVSSLCIYYF